MNKPSPADINRAINLAQHGGWIDCAEPGCWECRLYDPSGKLVGDGLAHDPGEAMGLAWINVWAPDALEEAYVEPDSVPHDIPPGWRFELGRLTADPDPLP
jgi:hypothetical protein